jgi:hypothetical protein
VCARCEISRLEARGPSTLPPRYDPLRLPNHDTCSTWLLHYNFEALQAVT